MNQLSKDEPPPPPTSVYQQVVGNDNILVGYVSSGATVNIAHQSRLLEIQQVFDQARVAYRKEDFAAALAHSENAARRLEPIDSPRTEAEIKLLLGYSAFCQYRKVRDKSLLVENAVPAFESVAENPALTGAASQKAEAFSYLAWCKAYLGDPDGASKYAEKTSAEVGANNRMAVWARRASAHAKVVEEVKGWSLAGAATVMIVVVAIIAVVIMLAILNWLLGHL